MRLALQNTSTDKAHEQLKSAEFCPVIHGIKKRVSYANQWPHMLVGEDLEKASYTVERPRVTQENKCTKKHVRFSDAPPDFLVDEIKTAEDIKRSWFTMQDYAKVRQENKKTLTSIRGGFFDDSSECVRGLETLLSAKCFSMRRKRTMALISTIITEQRMQRDLGVQDPYAISNLSIMLSTMAVGQARAKALRDACIWYDVNDFRKREVADERTMPPEKVRRIWTPPISRPADSCSMEMRMSLSI